MVRTGIFAKDGETAASGEKIDLKESWEIEAPGHGD